MDRFGEIWRNHAARMAEAWDATVQPQDVVLLAGDLSWATTLEEAALDLAWIGARPGLKVLLRGNHDSWWSSLTRVRAALPPGCVALQNDALEVDGRVVVGARGWTSPTDPASVPGDEAIHRREIERLKLSIADADRRFGRREPRLAVVHFPPWIEGQPPTEVVDVLARAEVRDCVYGHLHGADHARGVQGERGGLRFHLVAADAVDFRPVRIAGGRGPAVP